MLVSRVLPQGDQLYTWAVVGQPQPGHNQALWPPPKPGGGARPGLKYTEAGTITHNITTKYPTATRTLQSPGINHMQMLHLCFVPRGCQEIIFEFFLI